MFRKLRRVFYFRTVLVYACGSLCAILLLVNFNEDVKKLLQQPQDSGGPRDHDHPTGIGNLNANNINLNVGNTVESALMSSRDVQGQGQGQGQGHSLGGAKYKSMSMPMSMSNRRDLNFNSKSKSKSKFNNNNNNYNYNPRPNPNPNPNPTYRDGNNELPLGSVDRSYQSENVRPWFMTGGILFPQPQPYYSPNRLWPEEDPSSDRIVEQLMYVLDDQAQSSSFSSYSSSSLTSSSVHNNTNANTNSNTNTNTNSNSNTDNINLYDNHPQTMSQSIYNKNSASDQNRDRDRENLVNSQTYLNNNNNNNNNNFNTFNKSVNSLSVSGGGGKIKTILFYYGLGMSWGPHVTQGRNVFLHEKCPINTCRLSGNRAQLGRADAVIFKDVFMNPKVRRPPNQLWIMYLLECPLNTQNFIDKNMFNMTATYRHDSDIVAPYEKWVYHDDNVRSLPQAENYAAGKTKKVAWFVSNCVAKNNRLEYARELGKHIEVDIYGACGTHSCSRANAKQCFDLLSKHYKFYLAFENSNCRDYISEKFFVNGLGNGVIPIVMGAHPDDYRRVSPEKSYIHVDDFASPKELAQYLDQLDKNEDLYNEYFKWKGTGEFVNTHFFCRLCAMVHYAQNSKNRFYPDFNKWWRGSNVCTRRSWRNQPDIFAPDYYDKQTTHLDNKV